MIDLTALDQTPELSSLQGLVLGLLQGGFGEQEPTMALAQALDKALMSARS